MSPLAVESAAIAVDLHRTIGPDRALRYVTELDNMATLAEAVAPDAPEALSLREQATAAAHALREERAS